MLLAWKAKALQKEAAVGTYFISKFQKGKDLRIRTLLKTSISRPLGQSKSFPKPNTSSLYSYTSFTCYFSNVLYIVFLCTEPIVTFLSFYSAIIYSILYAFFAAFREYYSHLIWPLSPSFFPCILTENPTKILSSLAVVFIEGHGFSAGENGLAFLGVGLGAVTGTCLSFWQNALYRKHVANSPTGAQPEARLIIARPLAVLLPIGMFWFAWYVCFPTYLIVFAVWNAFLITRLMVIRNFRTTSPSVHWIVPILAGVPFGTCMIALFVSGSIVLLEIVSYSKFTARLPNIDRNYRLPNRHIHDLRRERSRSKRHAPIHRCCRISTLHTTDVGWYWDALGYDDLCVPKSGMRSYSIRSVCKLSHYPLCSIFHELEN